MRFWRSAGTAGILLARCLPGPSGLKVRPVSLKLSFRRSSTFWGLRLPIFLVYLPKTRLSAVLATPILLAEIYFQGSGEVTAQPGTHRTVHVVEHHLIVEIDQEAVQVGNCFEVHVLSQFLQRRTVVLNKLLAVSLGLLLRGVITPVAGTRCHYTCAANKDGHCDHY